ncbi:MAG: hypothetical protein K5678_05835 [Acetatifactor sp.]|nr:hypothetical protein [Acetatifactor sp.]
MTIEEMLKEIGTKTLDEAKKYRELWATKRWYPIYPGSPEWSQLEFYEESIYVLNPPQEMLPDFETKELVDLLKAYPYLHIIKEHMDNIAVFFDFMEANCDLFAELLRRTDGVGKLLDALENNVVDVDVLNRDACKLYYPNESIDFEIFTNQFTKQYASDLSEESIKRYQEILSAKFASYRAIENEIIRKYFIEDINDTKPVSQPSQGTAERENPVRNDGFTPSGSPQNYDVYGFTISFYNGTYTKYGVSPYCRQWVSGDYDSATIASWDQVDSNKAGWTFLASSTPKYNCHGYAWISKGSDDVDKYWNLDPTPYSSSSSFTYIGENVQPLPNDILVIYHNSELRHSAIVHPLTSQYSYAYITSKHGGRGLYLTTLSAMMLQYSGTSYKVYRHV